MQFLLKTSQMHFDTLALQLRLPPATVGDVAKREKHCDNVDDAAGDAQGDYNDKRSAPGDLARLGVHCCFLLVGDCSSGGGFHVMKVRGVKVMPCICTGFEGSLTLAKNEMSMCCEWR